MTQTEISIRPTQPGDAEALAALQAVCFPTLSADDWFSAEQYREHVAIFADGQLAAVAHADAGAQTVGATTTFRTSRDFDADPPAHYLDFIQHGWLRGCHEPDGAWLYGVDMSVHPDWRGRGIGSRLYAARAEVVRRLNLRGEIVAGLLPGYERVRGTLTVEAYAERVVADALRDPTLSMQLREGFTLARLMRGYVDDPRSDYVTTLLVRHNPHWWQIRPARLDEREHLIALMHRSKAHWGYDDHFMTLARQSMTLYASEMARYPVCVVEEGGRIVGFYNLFPEAADGALLLDSLFIEPDAIGSGHGRRLFRHAVETARRLGARRLVFDADPNAEQFYLKMGAYTVGAHESEVIPGRFIPAMVYDLSETTEAPAR